ncbi:MAG: ABC transporter permease [Pyrinomonadaceae bacterium]
MKFNKFFAVVRHEYKKIVLRWAFLIGTFLLPVMVGVFTFVPALIFSIQGEPTRIAIYDPTGKISSRLKQNLSAEKMEERARKAAADSIKELNPSQEERLRNNTRQFQDNFQFSDFDGTGKSIEEIRKELSAKVGAKEIDAFLIVPEDFGTENAKFEFFSRNSGDMILNSTFEDALNSAIRSQRLADANINEDLLKKFDKKVDFEVKKLDETGAEKEDAGGFFAGFVIALLIYITLAVYGQLILSAVVEEKETKVAEVLFSSASPFELMMGKLFGVGLAGLTQLGIWVGSILICLGILLPQLAMLGVTIPAISPVWVFYFFIFFLLGFFTYASIFALIGAMVPSVQEGGQFAFLPIMLMLAGFYFCFAILRNPNSTLSFWASIAPFTAPMAMTVRIFMETPPFWQILLAILINSVAIACLVWVSARVYRVGMLMYGKRATIPEVWKWIRQS